MRRMVIKQVAIAVLGIVGIPLVLSSPDHAGFWVLMGTITLVMLPGICVNTYFLVDIRRMDREGKRSV